MPARSFNDELVKALRQDLATAREMDTLAQQQYIDDGSPEIFKKAMETFAVIQQLSGEILSLTQP